VPTTPNLKAIAFVQGDVVIHVHGLLAHVVFFDEHSPAIRPLSRVQAITASSCAVGSGVALRRCASADL